MDLTRDEFVELLGCSKSTFYSYIGRSEFSNIRKYKTNKVHYTNITEENINKFKHLLTRKRGYCFYD